MDQTSSEAGPRESNDSKASKDPDTVVNEKPPPPAFPDGGVLAWIQCAAGFCIFFNTWGLLNTFGAFQSYYQNQLLRTSSPSDISWIGTLQSCFIMLGSVYSGPLYDQGYLRPLIWTGSFMLVFGMFMTSLCKAYWEVLLAQGLFMGLGLGCLFTPTMGILASYFSKRRGLAMGIASSGSSIGGIIYPITFYKTLPQLHFGWSTRLIAFLMLFLSILPVFGLRMRTKSPAVRKIFDAAAWKEAPYTLCAIGFMFGYIGLYIPYFYIQVFCLDKQIITGDLNFYLLPIMNAAGCFGRVAFGRLADIIGPLNAFITASTASAILVFGWMGVTNEAGVLVFVIIYGFVSAGLIILPATVVASALCPDMRQYGVRLTMQLVPSAIGLLIGNPVAGAISQHSWKGLQAFSAASILLCSLFTTYARILKVGYGAKSRC